METLLDNEELIDENIIDIKIERLQKSYMEILNKKYELKKGCDKYIYFSHKKKNTNKDNIENLYKYLKSIFEKIRDFQKRIDAGDGTNGVINRLVKIRNRIVHENEGDSSVPPTLLQDQLILSDHESVWEIYNGTREAFEKIFGRDADTDDFSWEDLINANLLTEDDYTSRGIDDIEKLKRYLESN